MPAAPLGTAHVITFCTDKFPSYHIRDGGVYATDTPYTTMNLERLDP